MSANFAQWVPMIASAAGSILGGNQNAGLLRMQARVATEQALADEAAKRRENRQLRGEQAAAIAESGLSGTGSSARKANQDAALAELDALNIRYHGQLRSKGLLAEAQDTKSSGFMMAGQKLLRTAGQLYRPKAA